MRLQAWVVGGGGAARGLAALLLFLVGLQTLHWLADGLVGPRGRGEQVTAISARPPTPPATEAARRARLLMTAEKKFMPDGTVHLHERLTEPAAQRVTVVYDEGLREVWRGTGTAPFEYVDRALDSYGWDGWERGAVSRTSMALFLAASPRLTEQVGGPVIRGGTVAEGWRLDPRHCILEGFDLKGARLGYLGRNGLATEAGEAVSLGYPLAFGWTEDDAESNPPLSWITETAVLRLDLSGHRVDVLLDTGTEPILTLQARQWFRQPATPRAGSLRPVMAVQLRGGTWHVLLRDPDEHRQFRVPWADGAREVLNTPGICGSDLFVFRAGSELTPPVTLRDPKARTEWRLERQKRPWQSWYELHRVTPEGRVELVRRFVWVHDPALVPAGQVVTPSRPTTLPAVLRLALIPGTSPALYWAGWRLAWAAVRGSVAERPPIDDEFRQQFSMFRYRLGGSWWTCVPLTLLSLAAVVWHARRRGSSRRHLAGWLALTALFNVAGLLTYLALNHTELVPCPACGRRRTLDGRPCASCGAPLRAAATPRPVLRTAAV